MRALRKIAYYDIRAEAGMHKPSLIGRSEEMDRLGRIVGRRINNNMLVVGNGGIGKTALVRGWMRHSAQSERYQSYALLQMDTEHISTLDEQPALEEQYSEAMAQLPSAVVFIDDFGRSIYKNAALMQRLMRIYKPLLLSPRVHLVLALQPHEHRWLVREFPAFTGAFETLSLKQQPTAECARIITRALPRLNRRHRIIVPDSSVKELLAYAERFPTLGQLPQAGIALLDEALSFAASRGQKVLTQEALAAIVETKTGVPKARLSGDELQNIRALEYQLNTRIVEQTGATGKIARTLQRAKLGLRNPERPLGSFLLLGPSGVGKTETAKCVAEMLFGHSGSFLRFDMSEFQQEHTVQRLIGAPAGYVGHDEGGALTNALKKNPYSLILLDEIEKAHPKVFDLFLQVLDEGRITSGQNETVDARNAVVMATSNTAVPEILAAYANGKNPEEDLFIKEKILPALSKTFRLEFINRFDNILLFKPLSRPALMQIAHLEIKKVERRLAKHRVRFELEPAVLAKRISGLSDPRFGARPVKRFIEETCETLLMQSLLTNV